LAFAKSALFAGITLTLLLQGCAQTPPAEPVAQPVAEPESAPEITLNMPQQPDCDCIEPVSVDYTFLEKGFAALALGEHDDAMEYFQRYQRLESSATAEWEADVAMAFTYSLVDSPLHDAQQARKSYRDLRKKDWQEMELHQQTRLMQYSLETFLAMERRGRELEETNADLEEDLKKREEAIKRLRELTLGQKGSAQ
jgi:tetratricopeptide (TPR) repeat protein